ncbi:MAG TPA: hypothetical protein VGI45_05170 [Terracidiphilus sp.]|jgi:hypothetical protein
MCRLPGRLLVSLFCLLATPSFGQMVGVVESSSARLGVTAPGCSADAQAVSPVRTQPYTAELKTTMVQLLANGVSIRHESTEVRALDSQGRIFDSRTEAPISADQPAFTWASVNDPVENSQAHWDSQTRTARVIKLPPESQRHGCWATDSGNMRMNYGPEAPADIEAVRRQMKAMVPVPVSKPPQQKDEDLGTITIEGVEAQGHRTTTVVPAGQIGNDKDLVTVSEIWYAPSIGSEVRTATDDPRSGRGAMELTHLDLSEPPLATFQPPEGYEVKVEELHQVPCEQHQMFGGVAGAVHGAVY